MKLGDEVELAIGIFSTTGDSKYNHKGRGVIVENDGTGNPFKVRWDDDGKTYGWYNLYGDLAPYVKKMEKVKIGELNCEYKEIKDTIEIIYKQYKYTTNFYGEPKTFIKENQGLILKYFINAMEKDVNDVLNNFSLEFDKLVRKLGEFYFPHTKDMIIAHTMEVLRKNVTKVAELFSEPQIKNTILSFFK